MTVDHAHDVFVNPDGTMTEAWHEAMKEIGEETGEDES